VDTVATYLPGQFYLRELPAIQAVLATTERMDLLVIDGYVTLDPHGHPSLGAHHTQAYTTSTRRATNEPGEQA
jgi:deoxyribonuclease V